MESMPRQISAIAIVLATAVGASAGYVEERKAGLALVAAGKNEEALAGFIRMAETAGSDLQKSDALQQAALCADRLKQYDRAIELAKQIPLAPQSKTCQMQIMDNARKWQDLVDKFKNEDIDGWPESIKGEAFVRRGFAHFVAKNGEAAAQDLQQAVEFITDLNSKGLCLNQLGDTYRTLLKDDDRAIAAYRRTHTTGNIYKKCQAAISVADILLQKQKYDAAIRELQRIDMDQVSVPYWRGAMLSAFGRALASAGKKVEAIARYREALELKDLPDGSRQECEKALQALQAGSKPEGGQ